MRVRNLDKALHERRRAALAAVLMLGGMLSPLGAELAIPAAAAADGCSVLGAVEDPCERWVAPVPSSGTIPFIRDVKLSPSGDRVFAAVLATGAQPSGLTAVSNVGAFDAATGALRWTRDVNPEASARASALAASPDGAILYLASQSGGLRLSAYDAASGATLWTSTRAGFWDDPFLALSADGSLLAVAGAAGAGAFDAATGAERWFVEGDFSARPAIAPDASSVYVAGNVDGEGGEAIVARALDAADGAVLWSFEHGVAVANARVTALSPDGSALYVSGNDGVLPSGQMVLARLDAASGAAAWLVEGPGQSLGYTHRYGLAVGSDLVFIEGATWHPEFTGALGEGGYDHAIEALDAATGVPIWTTRLGTAEDAELLDAIALAPDGATLLGTGIRGEPEDACNCTYEMFTLALDAATGQIGWDQAFGAPAVLVERGSAIAADAAGNVYVGGTVGAAPGLASEAALVVAYGPGDPVPLPSVEPEPDAVDVVAGEACDALGLSLPTGCEAWVVADGPPRPVYSYGVGESPGGDRVFSVGIAADPSSPPSWHVRAFDASDGAAVWTSTIADSRPNWANTLDVSADGARLFVSGYVRVGYNPSGWPDPYLYASRTAAYDAATGAELWRAEGPPRTNDYIWGVTLSPDGTRVFVSGASEAYDAATGSLLWTAIEGDFGWGPSLVSADGSTVFALPRGAVEARDAATGALRWASTYPGMEVTGLSPDGQRVFVAGASNRPVPGGTASRLTFAALDAANGQLVYEGVATDGSSASTYDTFQHGVVSSDGSLAVVAGIRRLGSGHYDYITAAFDAATGAKRWIRLGGDQNHDDYLFSVDVDRASGGLVYVTGMRFLYNKQPTDVCDPCQDLVTTAYHTATGSVMGSVSYGSLNAAYDWPYAFAAGAGGRAYLAAAGGSPLSGPRATCDVVGCPTYGLLIAYDFNQPPTAAGTAEPTTTDRRTAVSFMDHSSDRDGVVLSRAWDFGDGTGSSAANPTHTYAELGTFDVRLTATDDDGAGATALVASIDVRNLLPTAHGSLDRTATDRITPVVVTDASTDRDGALASVAVAWGDGATSDVPPGGTATHTYTELGTFAPTLTAEDNDGGRATSALPEVSVTNLPPVAAGTCAPTETDRLTPVQCTDGSTDHDGTIAAWLWDFGDGTTSTLPSPSHLYTKLGAKDVTLTVTDNDGATNTSLIAQVKVRNIPPKGAGGASSGSDAMGTQAAAQEVEANRVDPVQFTDQSTDPDGSIAAWAWTFGDGAASGERHPAYTYAELGSFEARVTPTDDDGDSGTAGTVRVTVVNFPPTAGFDVEPDVPMMGLPADFADASTDRDGTIQGWLWDFGDGTTSRDANPSHVFLQGGFFDVTLDVTDNDGGVARSTQRVWVCAPGVSPSALLEPGHQHLEVEGCVVLNGDELIP